VPSLGSRFHAALGGLPRAFWTLWWGLLVNRLGSFVIAFLAIYLVRDRGFGAAAAGRVLALYGIGMTVASPLGGVLADRIGRRATMILGLACGACSVAGLAFARDPALLAGLAFASAATGETYRPAMSAAVADLVPPPERVRAWGLVYWGVNLGLSLGLLLAGLVGSRSLRALFLIDAGTSAAFALILALRVPETRPPGTVHVPALRGMAQVFRDGPFAVFLGLYVLSLMVFTQWQLALPIDMAAHGLGPSAYAVLMALNCLGVVLLQPVLSPRLRGLDAARLMAVSALLFGLGFGVNAAGGSLGVYWLGTSLWTVGEVVGFPAAAALVADLAPVELRGRYQGAFSMTWGVAFTLAPLLAGEALDRAGPRALWLGCLAVSVAVGAGHLLTAGPRRRRLAALSGVPVPQARSSAEPA
jgi:MFS family permease